MVTPFIPYNPKDYPKKSNSLVGQGICSICKDQPAEFLRSRWAYCIHCCLNQLTNTQRLLYNQALEEENLIKAITLCQKKDQILGDFELKAAQELVELGLMEQIDHQKHYDFNGWKCTVYYFKVRINTYI